jgi:hypothetical protein
LDLCLFAPYSNEELLLIKRMIEKVNGLIIYDAYVTFTKLDEDRDIMLKDLAFFIVFEYS